MTTYSNKKQEILHKNTKVSKGSAPKINSLDHKNKIIHATAS
jgi:hypothetical protein